MASVLTGGTVLPEGPQVLSKGQKREVSDYYLSFVILLSFISESGVSLVFVKKTARGSHVYQLRFT